jgi:hypothetical protein
MHSAFFSAALLMFPTIHNSHPCPLCKTRRDALNLSPNLTLFFFSPFFLGGREEK